MRCNYKLRPSNVADMTSYLNELVAAYREGASGAADALLEAFTPLTTKYTNLLTYGDYDPADHETSRFMRILVDSTTADSAMLLSQRLRHSYSDDDIRLEVVAALLETAEHYNIIAPNLKYQLKNRVKKMLDSVVFIVSPDPLELIRTNTMVETGAIDTAWVNGITCSSPFEHLSPVHRQIIKYLFHDKLAESVAAKKLKISRHTLRVKKEQAINAIKEAMENPEGR